MKTVRARAAKTKLTQLLNDVAAGETIAITKHGRIVAILTPPEERPNAGEVIDAWIRERKQVRLGPDLTIRHLIDQGRPD